MKTLLNCIIHNFINSGKKSLIIYTINFISNPSTYLNLDLDEAMGRAYTENISIPFGVGICGSVAETKETIYIRDAYNDTRFNREVDAQTGYTTHSLVSMPVCNADGEVIGVAQIMNKTGNGSDKSQHEFSDTDLKVFRRYLTFCGIGLQNAQLFEVSILEYKKNKVRMCNNKGQ